MFAGLKQYAKELQQILGYKTRFLYPICIGNMVINKRRGWEAYLTRTNSGVEMD